MKYYEKNKKSSYLKHCDANNLSDLKWVEETFQFNEDFIKI